MTKKRRNYPDVEETISRPWCYYCERDFDDLKILISHQKAKHFKCERCGRRLNTAGGLNVHMNQVHKETLTSVENALPNRSGLDIEIFGMEGIPEDVQEKHRIRVVEEYYAAENQRRAATGNQGPGDHDGVAKKAKVETKDDLKKRLAEHKARKAAKAAGLDSGDVTPVTNMQATQSPGQSQSPAPFQAGSPAFGHSQAPGPPQYPPHQPLFGQFPPPAGFPGQPGFHPPYSGMPQGPPGSVQPPQSFSPGAAGLPQRPGYGLPGSNGPHYPHAIHAPFPSHSDAVDDLISSVVKESEAKAANGALAALEPAQEKKSKKADKNTRMIYADNETSPEEMIERLPRYSFTRDKREEIVLGEVGGAVTGVVMGQDTVVDRQG